MRLRIITIREFNTEKAFAAYCDMLKYLGVPEEVGKKLLWERKAEWQSSDLVKTVYEVMDE